MTYKVFYSPYPINIINMNEEEIRNSERLAILEDLGGDTYNRPNITRAELIDDINSLSATEYEQGAYKVLKHMFPNATRFLNEAVITRDIDKMMVLLDVFLEGTKYSDSNS